MNTKKIAYGGFFIALGFLFPQIFHLIGGPLAGQTFLPMHIPILLAGLLLGPWIGLFVGLSVPIISHLLTGMPPIPLLYIMVFELIAYGFLAGLLHKTFHLHYFISLLFAMIGGRIVSGLAFFVAANLLHIGFPPNLSIIGSIITGLPGIIIQILFIPILMISLKKGGFLQYESPSR
ncbi:MAG: ECF transporter S component [Epulopiscium sp.]|nr:ECF transporter S component [Candidatus Epulonipiscium sp.]